MMSKNRRPNTASPTDNPNKPRTSINKKRRDLLKSAAAVSAAAALPGCGGSSSGGVPPLAVGLGAKLDDAKRYEHGFAQAGNGVGVGGDDYLAAGLCA